MGEVLGQFVDLRGVWQERGGVDTPMPTMSPIKQPRWSFLGSLCQLKLYCGWFWFTITADQN